MTLHLRDATLDDLDDLTRIDIAVLPQQPGMAYMHPNADKYTEDLWKYTRWEKKLFIENTDGKWKYKVMICERENEDGNGKTSMETIGFAVWEVSALKGEQTPPASEIHVEDRGPAEEKYDDSEHRDANLARVEYYIGKINETRLKHLETSGRKDGPLSYLHLKRLYVDPKWQRHSAGTLLSRWGMEVATEQNLDIGLYAAPLGEGLYKSLGFKFLARVFVQMPGEEETVSFDCMKWEHEKSE